MFTKTLDLLHLYISTFGCFVLFIIDAVCFRTPSIPTHTSLWEWGGDGREYQNPKSSTRPLIIQQKICIFIYIHVIELHLYGCLWEIRCFSPSMLKLQIKHNNANQSSVKPQTHRHNLFLRQVRSMDRRSCDKNVVGLNR